MIGRWLGALLSTLLRLIRVSGGTDAEPGNAAVYVTPNDVDEYARAIVVLMDGESAATRMASRDVPASSRNLPGARQRRTYLGVYRNLIAVGQAGS